MRDENQLHAANVELSLDDAEIKIFHSSKLVLQETKKELVEFIILLKEEFARERSKISGRRLKLVRQLLGNIQVVFTRR